MTVWTSHGRKALKSWSLSFSCTNVTFERTSIEASYWTSRPSPQAEIARDATAKASRERIRQRRTEPFLEAERPYTAHVERDVAEISIEFLDIASTLSLRSWVVNANRSSRCVEPGVEYTFVNRWSALDRRLP